MHAEERVATPDSVKHRVPLGRLAQSDHSRNNSDPGNFLDPCSADISEWWAVLGSNQWPLPCETEVGCLRINDMRAGPPIATRTCCHLISIDITQCHGRT